MIEIRKLYKSYGRTVVLRDVDLSVSGNELTFLVGDNGAGKSTTLKILAGLARPTSVDRLAIDGVDARRGRLAQNRIAYLPQGASFHPAMTPERTLEFYAGLRGVSNSRIASLMETFGLDEIARKLVGELSGGMVQRLALAVLFLPDAPVLLADEPVASLDPDWRDRLQSLLREEASRGKAVLVATHFLEEWRIDADRVVLCRDGRIVPHENRSAPAGPPPDTVP